MQPPGNNFGVPEKPQEETKIRYQDIYENPNPEQQALNRIYHVVQEWYGRTMFDAPSRWVGYNSGLGFEIPHTVFGFSEPSLQRLLSLLHQELSIKKVGLEEIKKKIQISIDALNKFDIEKDIVESSRKDFMDSGTASHITKVKEALEQVLAEVS